MTAQSAAALLALDLAPRLASRLLLATFELALLGGLVSLLARSIGTARSPLMQRSAWNAVLLVALLVPATDLLPRLQLRVPVRHASAWLGPGRGEAAHATLAAPAAPRVGVVLAEAEPRRPLVDVTSLALAALVVWLAGVVVLLRRLLGAHRRARALRRRARANRDPGLRRALEQCRARLGVESAVELLLSDEVDTPFACGLGRPRSCCLSTRRTGTRRRVTPCCCTSLPTSTGAT